MRQNFWFSTYKKKAVHSYFIARDYEYGRDGSITGSIGRMMVFCGYLRITSKKLEFACIMDERFIR
jgi:hypothetical protein